MNFLDATRRYWVWAAAGRRWTRSLRRVLSLRDRRQKRVVLPACAEAMSREDLERPAVPYRGAVRAPIRGRHASKARQQVRENLEIAVDIWTGRREAASHTHTVKMQLTGGHRWGWWRRRPRPCWALATQ